MESELVSGFMTEHSAVIFVFFFLAEYASIVLICILTSILFLGGYLNFLPLDIIVLTLNYAIYCGEMLFELLLLIYYIGVWNTFYFQYFEYQPTIQLNFLEYSSLVEGFLFSLNFGIKACLMIFVFIWARASLPRIRFDQLMSVCWTILLPIIIAYVILIPCIIYSLAILPTNSNLL